MKVTTVHYTVAPDRIDQNAGLVRAVFAQLNASTPDGIQYASLQAGGGRFMHIVCSEDEDAQGLTSLSAFQEFQRGISERVVEKPEFTDLQLLENYRLFHVERR